MVSGITGKIWARQGKRIKKVLGIVVSVWLDADVVLLVGQ
jgi:hypothetical protein